MADHSYFEFSCLCGKNYRFEQEGSFTCECGRLLVLDWSGAARVAEADGDRSASEAEPERHSHAA